MSRDGSGSRRRKRLFSHARRRFTLYYFLSNPQSDVETLSVQVAAWEQSESIADVSDRAQQAVKISLHHCHLPMLAREGLLTYDSRSGAVVVAAGFEDVRPVIEATKAREETEGVVEAGDLIASP